MKNFNNLISQYVANFYVHLIKRKPNSEHFEWNQAIIQDYLNESKYGKSNKNSLSGSIHDLNKLDDNNQNALMWAFDNSQDTINNGIIYKLLNYSEIEVNQQDDNGNTILTKACQSHPDIVPALLQRQDIDSTIANKNGEKPLKMACKHNPQIIRDLLEHQKNHFNILEQDGDVGLIVALKSTFFDSDVINKMSKHPQINVSSWYDNGYKTIKWEYETNTKDKNKVCNQAIVQLKGGMTDGPNSTDIKISFYHDADQSFVHVDETNTQATQAQYKALQNIFQHTQLKQKIANQDFNKNANHSVQPYRKSKAPL